VDYTSLLPEHSIKQQVDLQLIPAIKGCAAKLQAGIYLHVRGQATAFLQINCFHMKKVMVILNGLHVSNYIVPAALKLAKSTNSFLHAIFLSQDPHQLEYSYFFPNDLTLTENYLTGKSIAEEDKEMIENNIRYFEDECKLMNVPFLVDTRHNYSLNELIACSDFFDLILIDAKVHLYEYLLSDLLADAHCPVLLTTSEMEAINQITFAYDGSHSSMYAIKMFTYLFPEWKDLPTNLVHITSKENRALPNETPVASWLTSHYSSLKTHIIQGNVQPALLEYLKPASKETLLVMGAFGRSSVSRMFHKSLSQAVINQTNAAVFITHN
jgi:hypothetical protein